MEEGRAYTGETRRLAVREAGAGRGSSAYLSVPVYGIKQTPIYWHQQVSDWMIAHDCLPIDNEKTIFREKY